MTERLSSSRLSMSRLHSLDRLGRLGRLGAMALALPAVLMAVALAGCSARGGVAQAPGAEVSALAIASANDADLRQASAASAKKHANQPGELDGVEKSILVNGYSTSYAWPDMLQEMLDAHSGGRRVYHVLNSVIGGAPVESWLAAPGTRDHTRTVGAMDRDFFGASPRLRGAAPAPTIVICQQSLQLTRDSRGPVKTPADMVGAEMGADALEKLAKLLHDRGLEKVYIAMHIYKEPIEPEVGNERVALARLLSRGVPYIYEGPDLWQATYETFPGSFEEDRLHPNEVGMKIMAEGWYRALAGRDAKESVIDAMWAKTYDVNAMMQAYLAWRRGG